MTVHFETESGAQTRDSYDQVVQELYKLGVAGLPPVDRRNPEKSWRSVTEQFNVLKTIEFLVSRRKRILADASRTSENRVDPLSSQTKNQQKALELLKRQSEELDGEIEQAKQRLQGCKAQREEQRQTHAKELKEIDRRIASLTTQPKTGLPKQ
jgi:chromosome segregation ATPase